jgi:ribosomal protein S18 acetylase RimI-like enzyme
MSIVYKDTKEFSCEELKDLFLSVEWSSGRFPEKLKIAMCNSDSVYSAWEGDQLIGLVNAMSDGIMNAYFQYLLVHPAYQGRGVGKKLVSLMLEHYSSYLRKTLIAYDTAAGFYKSCGFSAGEGIVPMSVTSLYIEERNV